MNRNQKRILFSLGGAAVLASAYYYFRNRGINKDSYEYHLKQFQKEFFRCDIMKLGTIMQMKFDKLFILATQDQQLQQEKNIFERIQYEGESLERLDSCKSHLKCGATYYECWDCSIIRQDIAKSKKKSEENCIYMTVCEDCFDVQKHKGHKYQRYQAANEEIFRCSCGDKSFMKQESFCSKHFGYDDLPNVFDAQEKQQPKMWKQIEDFFLDQFHLAFDTAGKLLYDTMTGQASKSKGIKDHLNTFLGFIFEKINEIIELNHSSMVFFTRLFTKTLTKPIQICVERQLLKKKDWRWKLILLNKRKVNQELSILEYILIFSKLIATQNENTIATLFRTFIKVSQHFSSFFSQQFFKYTFFIFKTQVREIQGMSSPIIRGSLPPLAHMMIEQVSLMRIFSHLVDTLGEEIFTPFDLFIEYLQTKPKEVQENDEVIYLLYNICFEMLKQQQMLSIVITKFYKQIIERLFTFSFQLFLKNSISIKVVIPEAGHPNTFLSNITQLIQSLHLQYLEQQVLLCFINFYEGMALLDDQELKKEIIPFICEFYSQFALAACVHITQLQAKQICFISVSLAFITQLPLLIALSEGKMFNEQVINDFFKKNFNLRYRIKEGDSEEEIKKKKNENFDVLISSINYVLNSFISINTQTLFFQQMKQLQSKINLSSPDGQQLQQIIQLTTDFITSPSMRIYDFFTLTYQIILLCQNDEFLHSNQSIFNKQITFFERIRIPNTAVIISTHTIDVVAQMLLDSSPFINVFSNTLQTYFSEFRHSNDEVEEDKPTKNKQTYTQIMNEILVSVIQASGKSKKYIKDVEQFCKYILHQPHQLEQYVLNVCKPHENNSIIANKDIVLTPEYDLKCYPKNFMRVHDEMHKVIKILYGDNNNPLELYPFIGSDINLSSLFPYQMELIERVILNTHYQQKLTKAVSEDSKFPHVSYFFSLQIYLSLHYLIQQKNNHDLTQEKQQLIKEITSLYTESSFVEKIKKQIDEELNLTKKRISEEFGKQIIRKFLEMLDQLAQI